MSIQIWQHRNWRKQSVIGDSPGTAEHLQKKGTTAIQGIYRAHTSFTSQWKEALPYSRPSNRAMFDATSAAQSTW